jgi:hypothetical protein
MDKGAVVQPVVPGENNLAAAKVTLSPETLADDERDGHRQELTNYQTLRQPAFASLAASIKLSVAVERNFLQLPPVDSN